MSYRAENDAELACWRARKPRLLSSRRAEMLAQIEPDPDALVLTADRVRADRQVRLDRRCRADELADACPYPESARLMRQRIRPRALLDIRCHTCEERLASAWPSRLVPMGLLFETVIPPTAYDLPHPPPWLVWGVLLTLPVEVFEDDAALCAAVLDARRMVPCRDSGPLSLPPPVLYRDVVDFEPVSRETGWLPPLYVRCADHELSCDQAFGFAATVNRAEIKRKAMLSNNDGRTRVVVV